ncbi:hypothetical protein [Phenylobacterium sp.]|jgi:hypothetical protein|uniref:hypothetical protein n=1 Tax=Phenylobacterium sp. TaxID=1871053 RepID=UPI002F9324AA
MDLIERYLGAIRSQLPDEQKADVTAELRDVLMSQIEDKEAELGRPLDRRETEELLVAFGHPLVVAGRYRKFNQLIGPEVFPFYWFALRTVLSIVAIIHVILGAVMIATAAAPGDAVGDAIGNLVTALVATVGWITLGFVLVEHTGAVAKLHRWSPHRLPAPIFKPRKSRFDAALELVGLIVFIGWWTGVTQWTNFNPQHDGLVFAGGPMRELMHRPVLWLAISGMALSAVELIRPSWNRLTVSASFAWHVAAALALVVYLQGGPLVEVSGPSAKAAEVDYGLNLGLTIGLSFAALGMAFSAARDLWWLVRGRSAGGPAVGATR